MAHSIGFALNNLTQHKGERARFYTSLAHQGLLEWDEFKQKWPTRKAIQDRLASVVNIRPVTLWKVSALKLILDPERTNWTCDFEYVTATRLWADKRAVEIPIHPTTLYRLLRKAGLATRQGPTDAALASGVARRTKARKAISWNDAKVQELFDDWKKRERGRPSCTGKSLKERLKSRRAVSDSPVRLLLDMTGAQMSDATRRNSQN